MTTQAAEERDGNDQEKARRAIVAAVTAGVTVTLLTVCAAAGSYTTVSGLAATHGIDLHWLAPAEIDGGLLGVILLDITLTWAGMPLWWLRLAARIFAAGTVAANAAAGWPSPVGAGLRCAAPLLIVVITEAGRAALLYRSRSDERKKKEKERQKRRADRIPPVRWLLAPAGTFGLWRRMMLRGETSYTAARLLEAKRRAAIGTLADLYGEQWKAKAPRELVWMLTAGDWLPELLDRGGVLTAADTRAVTDRQQPGATDGPESEGRQVLVAGVGRQAADDGHGDGGGGDGRPSGRRADSPNLRRARDLVAREPRFLRKGMGTELGRELGLSPRTGQRLWMQLTAGTGTDGEQR